MHYGCLATIIVYHQKRTTFIRDGSARSIHGWFRSAPLRCPATRCPQEEHKVGQTEECRCLYLCYQFKRLLRHNKCISLCSECISRVWGSKWPLTAVLVVMEFLLVQSCNRLYTSGKLKQKMFSIAGVSLFSNVLWCSEVFVYINNVCKHMPIFFIYISNYSVTSVKIPVQKWQIGCLIESIAEATKWVKMAWCRNICKKSLFLAGASLNILNGSQNCCR